MSETSFHIAPPFSRLRLANVDSPPLESLVLEDASRADERAKRRESPRAARTRAIRVAGLRYEMGENGRRRIR